MKASRFSLASLLIFVALCVVLAAWFWERDRSRTLNAELNQLKTHLGPDYFIHRYHPDLDRSQMTVDPLDDVNEDSRKLYQALLYQPEAWYSGLIQYLAIDRIRTNVEPLITMQVWWKGELVDDNGLAYSVYLADRQRQQDSFVRSAYIVTDKSHRLIAWQGTDIDGPKILSIELIGDSFPATIKFVEGSRHNGDASHESRVITKTSLK